MMAGEKLLQASLNHDIVVAQMSAICTCVAAWSDSCIRSESSKSGGRDRWCQLALKNRPESDKSV